MNHLWRWTVLPLLLAASACASGAGWRGDGTGQYPGASPPTQWDIDDGKNILWQTEIGKGHSSPVVAGNRVFVTAEPDLLICLDRDTGTVLWKKDNGYGALPPGTKVPDKRPPTSPNCGYATPTPVTDGKFVYASFGTGVVSCHDFDGNRKWLRYLDLPQVTQYGRSASPVLAGRRLIVSIGGLEALDADTGDTLWQTPEAKPAYGSAVAARIGEVDVLLTPGGDCVRLSDGKILARKMAVAAYTSPLVDAGVVYYVGPPAVAIRLPPKADEMIRPEKIWESDDLEGEFFSSPVCHEGILYGASNTGVLYALDGRTGTLIYKQELEIASAAGKPGTEVANLWPSLSLVGKVLVLANDAGETLVLVPGREYKQVARNYHDKGSGASPVADGNLLFLRGGKKLYCIGERNVAKEKR
ncbi:MAG: PQQ-like beta-propeller repeat protein [Planctomycetes bacterium]|nr:PQQ-like beta-propeller repeat protein [Planctomycetota bacterium]